MSFDSQGRPDPPGAGARRGVPMLIWSGLWRRGRALGLACAAVLLAAAPRHYVEQVAGMAQAAGLTVGRVTASAVAMSGLIGEATGQDLGLHLSDGGAELILRSGGSLRMLRRLSVGGPADPAGEASANGWLGDLAGELRRVLALLPASSLERPSPAELVIWDDSGQCGSAPVHLANAAGTTVHQDFISRLDVPLFSE